MKELHNTTTFFNDTINFQTHVLLSILFKNLYNYYLFLSSFFKNTLTIIFIFYIRTIFLISQMVKMCLKLMTSSIKNEGKYMAYELERRGESYANRMRRDA